MRKGIEDIILRFLRASSNARMRPSPPCGPVKDPGDWDFDTAYWTPSGAAALGRPWAGPALATPMSADASAMAVLGSIAKMNVPASAVLMCTHLTRG